MSSADGATAKSTLGTSAAKGLLWSALSMGANKFVAFASTVVLARLLAPDDFGVFAAALTLMLYLEVALDLGISAAVVYEQEEGLTSRLDTAFTTNVLFASVLTLVGIGIAPALARLLGVPDATLIFRVMSFYLLIRGLGQVNTAVLRRDLNFRRLAIVEISGAAARACISVVLAAMGYGVWSIVWGFLAGELASTVAAWFVVRFRPRLHIDIKAARSMLRFGLGVVALNIINELALNSDYLVVANRLGATALGFYTLAYRLPELLVNNAFWVFSRVAFPVYAKGRAAGRDAMRDTMLRALRLASLFGFAVGTGLAIVSRDAILVLFSDKWHEAITPMAVISMSVALGSIGFASGDIFPAMGRPGMLVKINAPLTAIRIVGFVIAAQHGIVAVALVHLITNFFYAFVRLAVADRFLGSRFRDSLRALVPGFCVAAGITLFALPVRLALQPGALSLVLVIVAGMVGGALGLFLAGPSVTRELRELVRRLVAGRSATLDPESVITSTAEDRDLVAVEVLALLDEAALSEQDRSAER
jgi:lipopolysaccharide exporter